MQVGFSPEFRKPGRRSGTECAIGGLLRVPGLPRREFHLYETDPEAAGTPDRFRNSEKSVKNSQVLSDICHFPR
jgi:hypothetical protein